MILFTMAMVGVTVATPSSASPARPEAPAAPPEAAAPAQDAGAGEAVYSANCASCHQAGGVGVPGSFPPMAGNPNVTDTAYVETVVKEGKSGPIEVNGESYNSAMPALATLSDQEVADVAAYVASLAEGGAPDEPAPAAEPEEPGTVAGGRALFEGSTALENGGGACSGCHAAGSIGGLGGSGLGPDLTDVADRLGGEAGLTAWLTKPPSPTMTPIFAERPMTTTEVADLAAFLVDAPSQKPASSTDWLVLLAAAGLAVLLGAMAVTYRGMRQTYTSKLQAKNNAPPARRSPRRRS
ncbi:MAG: c-type cytochrome [Microthrixaceae bacterium]